MQRGRLLNERDSDDSIGGPWGKRGIGPTTFRGDLLRTAEYSDETVHLSRHSVDLGPLSPARERG